MPRKPRIHLPGGFYHVILRGNGRQDIFFASTDRDKWQAILKKGLNRYGHRVHAYCWMTNHIHMAMQAGNQPLANFMRYVASSYARFINRINHRPGHLFERRYRAILINSDEYLLELIRYIHLNPVRARMVEQPGNYCWSSHTAYGGGERPVWLTIDRILQMFAITGNTAHRRYIEYMLQEPQEGTTALLRQGRPGDDRILGNDDWAEGVLAAADGHVPERTLEQLIDEVCRQHGVHEAALAESSRCRKLARIRTEIALTASEQGIATITEVARRFSRAHSGLVRSVNRLRDDRR